MEIAGKILSMGADNIHNPIDEKYDALKCELKSVNKSDEMFGIIEKYVKNTHGPTHDQYSLEVCNVFSVKRAGEEEHFKSWRNDKNRRLLWHGSRLSNWVGILSQGLRIAPPEAPVTGYMFGKGGF